MSIQPPDCPLCEGPLEWREASPCMECGGDARELPYLHDGTHKYGEVLLLGKFPLVLCDFRQVDFGTWPSYYFGIPRRRHLGFNDLEFVKEQPALLGHDWYCDECGYRHAFLDFVARMREHFAEQQDGVVSE